MANGELEITLDGKTERLRCTPNAARAVNAALGSISEGYRRLAAFDFEAYTAVVAAGIGKSRADVEAAVFRTGLPHLVEPLSMFLEMLLYGGKPKPEAGEAGTGEP